MSEKFPVFSLSDLTYNQLIPTHNTLRSPSSLAYFRNFFSRGLMPTRERPAILIQTEDNSIYIHDGHHYIYEAYKNGVQLSKLDIVIKQYTYAELNDINFEETWVTPYNPKYYVRRHVIPEFKKYIYKIYDINESEAITAIIANSKFYSEFRKVQSLSELC